jgi:hypothetical protein
MSRLVLHPEARIKAFGAGDYYEECCPGLGRAFTDSLAASFARIVERLQVEAVVARVCGVGVAEQVAKATNVLESSRECR